MYAMFDTVLIPKFGKNATALDCVQIQKDGSVAPSYCWLHCTRKDILHIDPEEQTFSPSYRKQLSVIATQLT